MLFVDAVIVLLAILIGVRKGGVALAFTGAAAMAILVFFCGLRPTANPPITVMLIILAVTIMCGALQCAGGLNFLVHIAEKILRRYPNYITFLAPIITFLFVMFTGTAFIAMALLPVIAEVALGVGVRPERPLSMTVVAASHGISASPVSAATAALLGMLIAYGVDLSQILYVLVPSIFIGIWAGAFSVYWRGKNLADDPEFQRRVAAGMLKDVQTSQTNYVPTKEAKLSVAIFGLAVGLILILALFKNLLPTWVVNGKTVTISVAHVIEIISMTGAGIILYACNLKPTDVAKSSVFNGGVVGVMVTFGLAWMADVFFAGHRGELVAMFGEFVQTYPWTFCVVLFMGAAVLTSQGATTAAFIPLGISLGVSPEYLIAMAPAVCAVCFFPVAPNLITAAALDRTGSTSLGTWVLNHSVMRPLLVTNITAIVVGFAIVSIL